MEESPINPYFPVRLRLTVIGKVKPVSVQPQNIIPATPTFQSIFPDFEMGHGWDYRYVRCNLYPENNDRLLSKQGHLYFGDVEEPAKGEDRSLRNTRSE